ncbi:hypothetical protein DPMN_194284 [Dreissena polymorpha]|uniref:CUB domain-containing protein n=1 Tax=Dreissena polymorpha TaxID=45954 RepID=A0A9D3Y5V5_DREPO|nr:hypothetical protein DPMN_194284 [Dreissena polymorpha]
MILWKAHVVDSLQPIQVYESMEGTCGGQLTANTGSIQSPGHPNVYPHGVNCTWNIIVTPGLVIRLTFHTFSMEDHVNCRYDAVTVYDNSTAVNSSRIGRYCGSNIPPVITSTNNELTVLFESDSSVSHEGFAASYVGLNASTLCGSDLSDATGVITSPNFPDGYPHERQCTWTITAPDGYQILLNVTDFNLENHPLCNFDYLEIRNGGFPSSPLVGKYCGTTIDRIIVSHSNRMYIKLRTDNSRSAPGFRIFYDSTATGCGADLTTPTGSFISPNYPNPYGHNAECIFTITVSRGSTILLTFVDLDLELHANCSYDYVEVRDSNAHGPLLGRFCGRTIPDMVTSKGNSLWILYNTDYSVGGRGFLAHYVSSCSNNQTAYSGVIESPNFPNAYPHNRNCTWIINAALGNSVNISFSHFDVETHRNCTYDYLKINDGNLPTSPTLGRFCGTNIPPPVASTQDKVWINFKSDYSMARNGFRLEYVTNGCGGYFRTPTGYFTSPNFPNPYPHMRQCEWTIVADTDSFVQLTIHTFDLESHSSCRYDVLEVYGGPDDSSPQLAKLCHKQSTAQTLASTGNVMFVRFKSDVSRSGNGFNASYKANTGGCGGNHSMKSGSIVSKNYPGPYPPNTDCEWLITVEDRHVVELTFADFDVETAENCTFDYVAVYDGTSTAAPELLRHCGNSLPLPSKYRSHGNSMYIRMRTDGTISHRGFKADYVTGCGGTKSETPDGVLEGDLVSPGYPGNYPRSSNCSWLIQAADSTDRVTLTFTHMDTENSRNCSSDYVLVRDGIDEGARVIGQYCGRTTPPAITSQGSALFVTFVSDYSNENSGFRATYTKSTSACGGDFTSQSGSFVSPGYPNSYPSNTECVWTVAVSPGNRVQLAFSVFNMEDHEFCNLDYVEIHEGQLGGPLLGRFCGENRPTNLTAYNGLWIKFRSDESASALGFVAQFSSVYGGEITGTSGQLASPNYPYTYPHRAHYMWTVTVPIGMQILVSFVAIDMESFRGCLFDFVKLRNGGTINSPLLGAYCGTTIPPVVLTTTNQLHVEFQSDWSSSGSGFLFDWTATTDMPTTTLPPTAGTTPVPGCGGTLNVTEATQSLSSPGWPYGYLNNLRCTWSLVAPVGSRVWMNITDMDIESSPTCAFDNITINRYGFREFRGILPAFCGRTRNTEPIVSVSNLAQVSFKTDGSFNRTGFIMDYKLICGGSIVADSGNVASPHFPGNYPPNSNCSWRLTVPAGRTVRVTFNPNFNIQGNPGSCAGDYVQLLNGGSATSPPLGNSSGKYCGTSAPAIMETSSNNLFVNFISDGSGSGVGFSLAFNEVHVTCGGQLSLSATRTSGMFTSPNYPLLYPQNVDCIWVISAPANERIQMDFIEDFSIETHRDCRYDFIELRDGGTVNSALLGSFCGNSLPSTVLSTGNVMYARFRTDNSIARKGFKAQYKIATCGGSYSGSSGVITSPNYPANYESNLDCVWIIRGPTGHSLTFTFEAFALEASQNCTSDDYLEIREVNSTGPVLILACGFSIPQPVFTSDNFAYVRFVSSGTVQYPGFRMKFEASVEECGGDLMLPSGSFQSPNFPGNYPHSRLCEWKISVQMGRRVAITFNPFNIEDHSRCSYDYVAIYNGIYPDSPLINRFCGGSPPDVVKTSGNTARVQFRTDGSNSNRGFQAFYSSLEEAECGGLITTSSGNITSSGYGFGNYSNRLDCQWVLRNEQSAENTSIFIRIADIGLERHTYCQYDYLQAREGDSIDGVLLDQYCGNDSEIHGPIISPMPAVWLRFKTDASIVDKGFLLTYNFTQCGGVLTDPYGIITSPNYPQDYDHDDACAWVINAPEGSRINVELTDFAMETHPQCLFDYLELFNGPYASSPSIGKFCGTVPPRGFKSQSNSVRIVFFTDFSMSARGFRLTYSFSTQGCGGLLHTSTGNLSTPNYPSSYPHNTECVWDLNVDPGYILTLTFNPPFDMEHQGDCDYDYVEVSDVISNGSEVVLGRWCSNLLPPPQVSSGPRLMVRFRSDTSTNGNGFSASWKSMCGGRLSMQSSFLTSPGFPRPYPNNLRCNYTLDMDPQRYTFINFDANNFDIEAGGRLGCIYDFIAVYEGNSSNGRMLGKFCGSTAPQPVSALGPMYVQFWTDRSRAGRGFRAQYHSSECGGVLTEPAGVVRTPTGPANYHNEMNCTWFITVQADRVIQFRFRELDLEAHSSCDYDYVDVFDGPNIYSPLIGRYCGNVIPTDLIGSTSNAMTLNFVSDTSWTGKGFAGVYRMTFGSDQGCGGLLNATRGQLGSVDGNGDGLYEAFLDCRWLIMGANNKVIRLNIMPGFNLENHTDCVYDYLKIYDGMTIDDPLIGTYCGLSYPSEIVSTSNVLLVQFYSDGSMEGPGFNATYTQQDALCGGAFTSSSVPQVITSPGFPSAFRRDVRCRWTIDAPMATDQVEVMVTALNLQSSSACDTEYLELRDYPLGLQGRSVHTCGVTPPPVFDSVGRTIQINYAATAGSSKGFSLTYATANCNRTYGGNSGQIFSPGWPGRYPINANCSFNLTTPAGTMISLYFNAFQLEPHRSCEYDYLEIVNSTDTSVYAKLCGWSLPDPVFVPSNIVRFRFVTDSSVTHPGYDITYTATSQGLGCGGNITGINGSFTSPGYPGNYSEASTCTWLVRVPARRVIVFTFTDMRMLDTVNCATDYVIVFDGDSDTADQFGRFCGDEVPVAMTTRTNAAFVKYVSNGQRAALAFRARFTS